MYLGAFRLGQWIDVPLLVRSGDVAEDPATAPLMAIYAGASRVVGWTAMPPATRNQTGMFRYRLRLGATFAVGRYSIMLAASRSSPGVTQAWFEIVGGGDADGAVVAAAYYPRPHADFLLLRLDSDQRVIAKTPQKAA